MKNLEHIQSVVFSMSGGSIEAKDALDEFENCLEEKADLVNEPNYLVQLNRFLKQYPKWLEFHGGK